jgi:hypothetical protein
MIFANGRFVVLILCIGILSSCIGTKSLRDKHYWFTEEIETLILSDSLKETSPDYYTDFAFVPDYDRLSNARYLGNLGLPDLDYTQLFFTYKKITAVNYILEESKKCEILVLNESHHYPSHRAFAASLLLGLKNNGYKYIGIEALTNTTHFYQPVYPNFDLGYYINEPTFGNFIREALRLGFVLFPYEDRTGKSDGLREEEQAKNCYQFLKDREPGKVFLYCGYDHNLEGDLAGWGKSMTGRLEELTGLEILTINQTYFNEISDTSFRRPFVLIDSLGANFQFSNHNDVFVFHPDYLTNNDRAPWKKNETNSWRLVDFIPDDVTYPLFVAVFSNKNEIKNGVPYDLVELKSKNEIEWIVVPDDEYTIVIEDRRGKKRVLHS